MQRYRLLTTHALTSARVSPSCATCGSAEARAARAVDSGRTVCRHDGLAASWPRHLIPLSLSTRESEKERARERERERASERDCEEHDDSLLK